MATSETRLGTLICRWWDGGPGRGLRCKLGNADNAETSVLKVSDRSYGQELDYVIIGVIGAFWCSKIVNA